MSSISSEFVKEFEGALPIVAKEEVETRTLNSVLVEHNVPGEFELFSIDVEAHDFEVLRSIDLIQYKPRLIVIEMRTFDLAHPESSRIVCYLAESGYKMVAYYSVNGFFLRTDSSSIG